MATMAAQLLPLVLILCGTPIVTAFSPTGRCGVATGPPGAVRPSNCKPPTSRWNALSSSRTGKSQLGLIDHELALEMGAARGAFALCFYGALGVGSIGRELIPIVFRRYESNNELLSSPPSSKKSKKQQAREKTDDMGIRGYPEPIYLSDVEYIISNKMDALTIAKRFDERSESEKYEYTHLAEGDRVPFLTFDSYQLANPAADPMALRAVFDSFSNSIGGGNVISPITAQERLDEYKEDVSIMTKRLNGSKVLGVTAFVIVLVLLGFADYLTIYHLWR